MKETFIYYPPESPEGKQNAKEEEKKHLERGYAPLAEDNPKKFEERQTPRISEEESAAFLKEAEKARKKSRGLRAAEFKDWWSGIGQGEGAKKFAEWIFDKLFAMHEAAGKEDFRSLIANDNVNNIEQNIKRLAEETVLHGGQEDILLYFTNEWRNGINDPRTSAETRQKILEIWNEYLKKASIDLAEKEK